MNMKRRLGAAACALLMTASAGVGVFAGDETGGAPNDPAQSRPAQQMDQQQIGQQQGGPADTAERPELPEIGSGERPEIPESENGERPEPPEMKDGKVPAGPKESESIFKAIGDSDDSAISAIKEMLGSYSSAVDSERTAADSDARMTAAQLVKDLADAINAALESAGFTVSITAPADKPEVPSN